MPTFYYETSIPISHFNSCHEHRDGDQGYITAHLSIWSDFKTSFAIT